MTKPALFRRVSLVGLGLIGGSWGLALKQRGFAGRITGCDQPAVLDRALALGAIDRAEPELATAVRGADLVILAVPVGVILEQLASVWEAASPGALVTDTGSTKRVIMDRARGLFGRDPLFVGGHPLAGKEQSGIENAENTLFEGTCYIVSPLNPADLDDDRVIELRRLIESMGALPYICDAETHDHTLAFFSHLPQLLSTGLASVVAEEDKVRPLPLDLAAAGFRDMTRLAESPYTIWRDICSTNEDKLRQALDVMIRKLETIKGQLTEGTLEHEFEQGRALRECWRKLKICD